MKNFYFKFKFSLEDWNYKWNIIIIAPKICNLNSILLKWNFRFQYLITKTPLWTWLFHQLCDTVGKWHSAAVDCRVLINNWSAYAAVYEGWGRQSTGHPIQACVVKLNASDIRHTIPATTHRCLALQSPAVSLLSLLLSPSLLRLTAGLYSTE